MAVGAPMKPSPANAIVMRRMDVGMGVLENGSPKRA
jgi:hypothetical protein